jgi:hypothetical protein
MVVTEGDTDAKGNRDGDVEGNGNDSAELFGRQHI